MVNTTPPMSCHKSIYLPSGLWSAPPIPFTEQCKVAPVLMLCTTSSVSARPSTVMFNRSEGTWETSATRSHTSFAVDNNGREATTVSLPLMKISLHLWGSHDSAWQNRRQGFYLILTKSHINTLYKKSHKYTFFQTKTEKVLYWAEVYIHACMVSGL